MHRALEIPEIPPMIVSHFDPDNYELGSGENIDSPTLAALARCRVFHEAAVNQLWKKQETLVNLIRCLPEDISNIKDLEESDLVFHPDYYGRRVKICTIGQVLLCDLAAVMKFLRYRDVNNYLLPNLVELHWQPVFTDALLDIELVLGPRLSHLSVILPSGKLAEQFFATISRTRPSLTSIQLQVDINSVDATWQSILSRFVCSFPTLTSLYLTSAIDADAILHLGELGGFKSLRFDMHDASFLPAGLPRGQIFQDLSVFAFTEPSGVASSLDLVTSLVQSWDRSPLTSFKIDLESSPSATSLEALFRALSEHCSHDALHTIEITLSCIQIPDTKFLVSSRGWTHLLMFPNLSSVQLLCRYRFDDEDMHAMATAWPELKTLELMSPRQNDPSITLRALLFFARHCPKLESLQICLDARTVPSLALDDEPYPLHPALRRLFMEESLITQAVAAFISCLFPNSSFVHSSDPVSPGGNDNDAECASQ
ncbi:hypothetical protein R3P38DRAFT_3026203 [Favolaschia claudopus]|uniref:F-box domain-containing protein n=1 Tax=Favolaschia claudopus TaxID=2862362 RepID=A0AAW0AFI3_9AGAR